MTLQQLINQNLADITDVINEGSPTDIRDLVKAQTEIAYEAGRQIERVELLSRIKAIGLCDDVDIIAVAKILNKLNGHE